MLAQIPTESTPGSIRTDFGSELCCEPCRVHSHNGKCKCHFLPLCSTSVEAARAGVMAGAQTDRQPTRLAKYHLVQAGFKPLPHLSQLLCCLLDDHFRSRPAGDQVERAQISNADAYANRDAEYVTCEQTSMESI